jgi:hypothetical protein
MREEILRKFFCGEVGVPELARDLAGAKEQVGPESFVVHIENMANEFAITRPMLISLCDAVLSGGLPPADLGNIGFALMASDRFEWDADEDELVADVIADWSCPEVNFALTTETVERFRRWLTGDEAYPQRPATVREGGKTISVTEKRSIGMTKGSGIE